MLLSRSRCVQDLLLLCALCCLTLAFPTQTPFTDDEVQQLKVNIPHSDPIVAPLGSSISIPCSVSLSTTATSSPSSSPVVPRVKWTVVSGGVETQILVARGQRIKVNDVYRDRAALLNYTSSTDDLSLWLGDLRSSDSGHYRCEVQQGLEDASDLIQLKVKGVVFLYRDALDRYAFSFSQAQRACKAIGAQIATPDQLLAAYYDGYEQCDAGWLADQSVRYPIQVPREGCYGDMDGQPGVRNYGTMDTEDLFDVYCYVEQIDGEVFHNALPLQLTFNEAQSYCRAAGAELATTAQLYSAWSEGLDRCSPGWLADGSVRYPIITPRERCGGPEPGVKTVYRFSNRTGFPESSSLHDVYCFRDNRNTSTDSPLDYVATEAEDIRQNVVILMDKDQELHLNQQAAEQVEREAQSVLESLPFFSPDPSTEENPVDTHSTVTVTTESPLNTKPSLDLPEPFNETVSATEMSNDALNLTALINSTNSMETYDTTENTTFLQGAYNGTDSHQNLTVHQLERTTQNQTTPDPNTDRHTDTDSTQPPEKPFNETQEIKLNFNISQGNYSDTGSNHTQEEALWEETDVTLDPMLQVKLEEATVEDPLHMSLTTQASKEEAAILTQLVQTTKATTEALTSLWTPVDGSGDTSQESILDMEAIGLSSTSVSSTAGHPTHPSPSGPASSAAAAPHTAIPEPTLLSGTHHPITPSLDVLSTAPQLWESSISRQEGSASLEIEDMESETKQLFLTKPEDQLATTESPEGSDTTHSPIKPATARFLASNYSMYWDTVTSAYEEASGHEPGTFNATIPEDMNISLSLEEEANASFSLKEEVTVEPTLVLQEAENISSVLEEEAKVAPTIDVEEEATVASTFVTEEEAKVDPMFVTEEEAKVDPTFVTEEEANITSTLEEDVNVVATSEEEANVAPTLEDFTIVPLNSQTSTLLTTTTRPQESLNDSKYNRKTTTTALDSSPSTKSTAKPTTISTTTHWSRRTWSPTTTTNRAFHETAKPQKVMPPMDHGLLDVEISLTQPPTLLILPDERAAVGGAGRSSDACVDDPCLNGGTCTDRGGQIKCLCLPTYGGDFCQTDLERCEPGWDKFHGFCYRHFSQRLSWEVAEQHCRMMGAHLVSVMTPEEQTYINDNYKEYQWTGLNDKTIENDFRWSDGNPLLYENWYRGQPDSYFLSGEDCVVMVWHDNGRWSDAPCNYQLAYTCKKGTSSCGPPPRVRNASIFGKVRQRYETSAVVRYHCTEGFQQRLNPLIRCLPGGMWERPQILCTKEAGGPTLHPEVTSPTDGNFAAAEDDFEATKETPQYWDIKF
ncbi:brevican core protein-like [Parambassis ranga]|uniref:Brevican core protein-like n=1 Tax=Parambassis ranga TaxID=210632 RepID=A0A6P7HWG3_9TELE|nr:brevican core protein-like [Parambassis ranga]